MPTSPRVKFNVVNDNLAAPEPTLGVGMALAITTKGEPNRPDTIINSVTQFREVFGSEVVPDNTPSNIERALNLGAKMRICSVMAADGAKGTSFPSEILSTTEGTGTVYSIDAKTSGVPLRLGLISNDNPDLSDDTISFMDINLVTKEYGGDISSVESNRSYSTNIRYAIVNPPVQDGTLTKLEASNVFSSSRVNVFLDVYDNINPFGIEAYEDDADVKMTSTPILSIPITTLRHTIDEEDTPKASFVDISLIEDFLYRNELFDVTFDLSQWNSFKNILTKMNAGELSHMLLPTNAVDNNGLLEQLTNSMGSSNLYRAVTPDIKMDFVKSSPWNYGIEGTRGSTPTADDWISALDSTMDYDDFYMMFASHVHQHLASPSSVHNAAYGLAERTQEFVYALEIPKENKTKSQILDYQAESANFFSKKVAQFAGGNKVYNTEGVLVDGDVLGTVMALHCNSSSEFGPWYSFAGQRRGLIGDSPGPVAENFGSNGRYDDLNDIAQASINMIVVKRTALGNNSTMLWHNFTSTQASDSERFLNVTMCILYIKKALRPILERYIEEPNTFSTWASMYLEIAPVMEDLQNRQGVHSWDWQGDQNATSFDDLLINNEQDVRQGKYKALLKIKEVVALQEIDLTINLDKASGSVSVTQ